MMSAKLGEPVRVEGRTVQDAKAAYEHLLDACIKAKCSESEISEDEAVQRSKSIIGWLGKTDFYDAPASTRYHEAYPHGLLHHTVAVYNRILELRELDVFKEVPLHSAALVALTHDWCKIGMYEKYLRNVKNEETGEWEQVAAYRRSEDIRYPFGHGETSLYIAMRMFALTKAEALAIRWHMGRWYVDDGAISDFQIACRNYPLVHLLQFADELACVNY